MFSNFRPTNRQIDLQIHNLQQWAWNNMSEEEREASLQDKRDKRDKLIDDINREFAIVTDGPRAGQIVSVSDGKQVSRSTINALHIKDQGFPATNAWLIDSRRREISDDELRKLAQTNKPASR